MKTQFRDLKLNQLDAQLRVWREQTLGARPQVGWVRAIREALGMSAAALARRLNMSLVSVRKLEISEAQDTITLASLRKLAEALDCELRYALVPKTSLEERVQYQAEALARARLAPILHSMALEDQQVQAPMSKLQLEQEVKGLLEGSRRALWRDKS